MEVITDKKFHVKLTEKMAWSEKIGNVGDVFLVYDTTEDCYAVCSDYDIALSTQSAYRIIFKDQAEIVPENEYRAIDKYQQRCLQTWFDDKVPLKDHMLHVAIGLASEAGEFASLVDKQTYKPSAEITRAMMLDELGDVFYNVVIAAHLLGVTIDELDQINVEKLKDGHGWVELTKYDWSTMSPIINYIARDKSGQIWGYEQEPRRVEVDDDGITIFTWIVDGGKIEYYGFCATNYEDWKNSLEQRPQ